MRPKIIEENIDNFIAVTKDTVTRFVQLNKDCGPNDHIPDLEGELSKWSTESKLSVSYGLIRLIKEPAACIYVLICHLTSPRFSFHY